MYIHIDHIFSFIVSSRWYSDYLSPPPWFVIAKLKVPTASSSGATAPPLPHPKASSRSRYRVLVPLILGLNFTIGGFPLIKSLYLMLYFTSPFFVGCVLGRWEWALCIDTCVFPPLSKRCIASLKFSRLWASEMLEEYSAVTLKCVNVIKRRSCQKLLVDQQWKGDVAKL